MRVVVIGAGLAGVSAAYYLHEAGLEVTVLERQPAPARETSYANGAMLTPSLADPWNSPGVFRRLLRNLGHNDAAMLLRLSQIPKLARWGVAFLRHSRRSRFEATYLANARLAQHSQALLAELLSRTELDIEFAGGGIVKIFEDEAALEDAIKVAHWLKQAGIEHRPLDTDALLQLEPSLGPGAARLVGAVHYPDDQVANARLYCERVASWLADQGVTFHYSEQVRDFDCRRGQIDAVHTARGAQEADAFVLAAGSFSAELARQLKLRIPLAPAKGYSITLEDPPVLPRHPLVDDALHAAVVPLGGRLRVAGTAEFAGFDLKVTEARLDNLKRLLGSIYPQLSLDGVALNGWTGLRPMAADGRPLIGQAGPANLFLNTGHGALGWTHANASGQLVAGLVLGRKPSADIAPFLASRRV
jgi:D-amino-acid dehydrogenase